jgi:putative tryptophan/tyrosine transport system substrate-binding protein
MAIHIRRRKFIFTLGGAAAAWPLAARAQQPAMPVVGFLGAGSAVPLRQQIAAFREGLRAGGYIENQNVAVEYRFAEGQFDRLPALASDLVHRQVNVLVASTNQGALAAKQATSTIPIVFSVGGDPVEFGLVTSLNRPGGNMTGVYQFAGDLETKRLGLLHELVPNVRTVAVLVNPDYSGAERQLRDVREAAPRLDVELVVLRANRESDLDAAFSTLSQNRAGALLVCASPFFYRWRDRLVLMSVRHAIPAIFEWRDFAAVGGLMSYGTNLADAYRQVGVYTSRLLKGEKPADLPVVQSTTFEFVINLNAAKTLGLEVPPTLLARADEVIE